MATEPEGRTYDVCKHGLLITPNRYDTGKRAREVPCPVDAYWHQHYLGHHPEVKP